MPTKKHPARGWWDALRLLIFWPPRAASKNLRCSRHDGPYRLSRRYGRLNEHFASQNARIALWSANKKSAPRGGAFLLAEMVGFEPTCPAKDKTISNRSRYDHFDTSPCALNYSIINKKIMQENFIFFRLFALYL